MSLTEVISNSSLRGSINQNYLVDTTVKVSPLLFIGPGAVMVSGNQVSWPGGFLGYPRDMNQLGQSKVNLLASPFTPGTQGAFQVNQVFVDGSTGKLSILAVSSPGVSFPAGSLPVALVYVDGSSRIQQVTDVRPMPPM